MYLLFNFYILFAHSLNANFNYRRPIPFNGSKNTGILGDLQHGGANFGFNAQGNNPHLFNGTIGVSNSFERHDICIIVPKAEFESILYNLIRTLSPLTWLLVVVSVFVIVVIFKWLQRIQRHWVRSPDGRERTQHSWPDALSIHFQSFFGDSIIRLPNSWTIRCMIVCWCLYSFLICTAFTAKLISSLVLPKGLADINSMEELGQTSLKIIYPDYLNATLYRYLENDHQMLDMLRDQMEPVAKTNFTALIGMERHRYAYVLKNYMADYMVRKYIDTINGGRPSYHRMSACLVYMPRVYLLQLGSPYARYLNEMLGRFYDMGLMVQWQRQSDFRQNIELNKVAPTVPSSMPSGSTSDEDDFDVTKIQVVITMNHMQAAFYVWVLGLLISAFAYVIEWWWYIRTTWIN